MNARQTRRCTLPKPRGATGAGMWAVRSGRWLISVVRSACVHTGERLRATSAAARSPVSWAPCAVEKNPGEVASPAKNRRPSTGAGQRGIRNIPAGRFRTRARSVWAANDNQDAASDNQNPEPGPRAAPLCAWIDASARDRNRAAAIERHNQKDDDESYGVHDRSSRCKDVEFKYRQIMVKFLPVPEASFRQRGAL